jgi:Virulence activator alpha C-term
VLAAQVRARREAAERLKADLNEIDARVGDRDFYSNLTRRYGHSYADAIIRWAKEVEQDLAARTEP